MGNAGRRTGAAGVALVRAFEGFRARPYLCQAGYPTVGYGALRYLDGMAVTLDGRAVSVEEAESMLRRDLGAAEVAIARLVSRPLDQCRFDALASFVFNLGAGAFRASTLRRRVDAGDDAEAVRQFGRWVFAAGVRSAGLVRRRAAEAALYMVC